MTLNIAKSLGEVVNRQGGKIGLIEAKSGKTLTFSQIEERSDEFAWYLHENGVHSGDRVMLMVKPSADFICLTFALFKIGSPVILIDPGMGYRNLLRCVSGVNPKVFIGVPAAHVFLRIFKKYFRSVQQKFCCGQALGIFGTDLSQITMGKCENYPIHTPNVDDLAAIIFTTGSTGPPKGVRYEHSIFAAQLRHIEQYYKISSEDVDQPAFPLFALFSTALGACAVIPDMDSTKPAKVDPRKFVTSIFKNQVTYSFGSPALWNVVSNYCIKNKIKLDSVKKVLMAGAPVPGNLIERVSSILSAEAEIHTPYGATESLPIVSIEGKEILEDTWLKTKIGKGTCVGRPLPNIDIKIITLSEDALPKLEKNCILKPYEIGEIIVSGDVVTQAYDNNDNETRKAKTTYDNKLWHRMGDTGYIDDLGRLWFCGRKAHIVKSPRGVMYTIQCEAVINNHDDIFRSALVGVPDSSGFEKPVIILEVKKNSKRSKNKILKEIKFLSSQSHLTKGIDTFLFHDDFPVDIRHNAKIFREKLKIWAQKKLKNNE